MTAHKHLKQLVRSRMDGTGESYTTARRHVIRHAEIPDRESRHRWHLAGNIPATTALRILLSAAGLRDPRNGQPLTEAMLFGICGGIGAGAASFHYAKEDFSSFYLAGRHLWHDDLAYSKAALARIGIEAVIRETTGTSGAAKQLREALMSQEPCMAWVDMANLPHRGMPKEWSGSGYHVITVYEIDEPRGLALIGDLADDPVEISMDQLGVARGRIKMFKNRLLSVAVADGVPDLSALVRAGLAACDAGLKRMPGKGAAAMSGLEAIGKWAAELRPSTAKDCWAQKFPRGHRLWQGLTSIHEFIEHYHTGGGLCRPLFADFLAEAADVTGWKRLGGLSRRYAELGAEWTVVAHAAIPPEFSAFREVRELCSRRAELRAAGYPDGGDMQRVWARLAELQKKARTDFPLSEPQSAELLASLHRRVTSLHDAEVAVHAALSETLQ